MSFYAGAPATYGAGYGAQYPMTMPGTTAYGGYGAYPSYGAGYSYPGYAGQNSMMMPPYAGQNQMMMMPPAVMQPYMGMAGYSGLHGAYGGYPHGMHHRRRRRNTCCGSNHHDDDFDYYDGYEYDRRHRSHGIDCD